MSAADLTELRRFVEFAIKQGRTFYFHAEAANDPDALGRGLAGLFRAPHLYRLSGEHVTAEQGSEVLSALLNGDTLMLLVNGPHPLAVRFLQVWSDANRRSVTPAGTRDSGNGTYFAKIGRHLTISLDRSPTPRGILVVLQIGGPRNGGPSGRFLHLDEIAQIERLGATTAQPIARDIGVLTHAEASRLTFKDLCLLGARDGPKSRNAAPNPVIENREAPISWLDLREIVRVKGSNAERQLRDLHSKGLLDDEQWNFFELAIDFLDLHKGNQLRSDIYEAVWHYEFLEADGYYFRGQRLSTWRLDTTLFRPSSNDMVLDLATIVERTQRTSLFLEALRQRAAEFFLGEPTDEDLLAVAQHYGFATPLLDFSRSLRVAAFFATHGEGAVSSAERRMGIIYYLKPDDRRSRQLLDRTDPIGLHGFDLLREAGLHFGQWKVLQPALVDADNRIARQRGAFLEGANVRHLSGVMLDRIVFEQRPGQIFEDSLAGVTAAELLPDSSRLAEFAEDVKRRFAAGDRAPVHAIIAPVSLPTPSIIGVQHAWLDEQVDEAVDFFSLLREVAEQGGGPLIRGLVASIREYFVGVRLLADVGGLPSPRSAGHSRSSALERAVARMCEESGSDYDDVWKIVSEFVPDWEDGTWRAPEIVAEQSLDRWLVLACAVYLVGWEHLTSVQGARSRGFAVKAREIIHMVKSQLGPEARESR
jgi:hypothetical protein